MAAEAELCELPNRQVSKYSSHPDVSFWEAAYGSSWPGPEILAIKLIAENQPFDSTWHEKFRCNRHGQLMADSTRST